MRRNSIAKFWTKVNKDGDVSNYAPHLGRCWFYLGTITQKGYGQYYYLGVLTSAHRLSYLLTNGSIPDDLQIDHLCRVRHCVNPKHLEPVTPKENTRRGLNAPKPYCRRGHKLTKGNVLIKESKNRPKSRICKICNDAWNAQYRLENRAKMKVYNARYKRKKRLELYVQAAIELKIP